MENDVEEYAVHRRHIPFHPLHVDRLRTRGNFEILVLGLNCCLNERCKQYHGKQGRNDSISHCALKAKARIGIKSRCMEYTLHGLSISDPWLWLEDLDSEETRMWVET